MIIADINVHHINDMVEMEITNFKEPWDYKILYHESQVNPNSQFYGAFIDGKIVGYVGFWKMVDYVDIINISVHQDYKRRGIASALMEEVYALAIDIEVNNIFLEVNVNNEAAINLYEKLGFVSVRRIKNYYSKLREDAFLMQKEVTHE